MREQYPVRASEETRKADNTWFSVNRNWGATKSPPQTLPDYSVPPRKETVLLDKKIIHQVGGFKWFFELQMDSFVLLHGTDADSTTYDTVGKSFFSFCWRELRVLGTHSLGARRRRIAR